MRSSRHFAKNVSLSVLVILAIIIFATPSQGAIVQVLDDSYYTSGFNAISKPSDRIFSSVLGPRATQSFESFSYDGKWKVWGDVTTQLIHSTTFTSIFVDLYYQHIIPDPAVHTPPTEPGEIFSLTEMFRTDDPTATYDPTGVGSLISRGHTGKEAHPTGHRDLFNVDFFFALATNTGPTGSPTTNLAAWRIGLNSEHQLTSIPLPAGFYAFAAGLGALAFFRRFRVAKHGR